VAKPFSIQSPEDIAKEYGGNKQRIAQAMQLGVVDATAGVLAGMFIDRMRSAQVQEGAPQATVAQQVMGGVPAAPPPPPSGGLGATPPMAPQMQAPMAPPADAPMGMAEGGIAGLDVPSTMFDESTNGGFDDGYAGGGLVAFADGGAADLAAFRRAIIQQESGGRYGVPNAEGSGAMGIGQIMPDTARALAKRLGLPYRPDLLAGKDKAARDYQIALTNEATREAYDYGKGDVSKAAAYYFAGPDKSKWGDKTKKYQNDILRRLGSDMGEAEVAERDLDTAAGRAMSLEDALGLGGKFISGLPREELDRAKKYALEELDPANQEKARKADMWQALAEMGFRMASSDSPYVLQAIGQAATATLPGVEASKKERKAAKDNAVKTLMAVEDVDRKAAVAGVELGMDIYKQGLSQEQFKQQMAFREKELASLEARSADELALKRDALAAQAQDKTDFDKKFAAVKAANPGLSDMQVLLTMKNNGLLGSAQGGLGGEFPDAQGGGAPQGGGDIAIVGSRPAQ
jgi:hypothetical protein